MKKILASALCALGFAACGAPAAEDAARTLEIHPRAVQNYSAYISAYSPDQDNIDLLLRIGGWECSASANATFREDLLNYKGQLEPVVLNTSSRYNSSTVWQGRPSARLQFTRNSSNQNPRLNVSFTESCSKNETYTEWEDVIGKDGLPVKDRYGRPVRHLVEKTRTKTLSKEWTCEVNRFHMQTGRHNRFACQTDSNSWGQWGDFEAHLVTRLRKMQIVVDLALDSQEEKYAFNNCGNRRDGAYLLRLRGGVGGHMGENDFKFNFTLDSDTSFELRSPTGHISEDVLYCPKNDNVSSVKLDASAVEDDAFFDDVYVPQGGSLALSTSDRNFTANLLLRRKTYFGQAFTPRESNIKIEATLQRLSDDLGSKL